MLKRLAFVLVAAVVSFMPTAAHADVSVGSEVGGGNVNVSGHHNTATKVKPRVYKASSLSHYVYVDPYAGLTCVQIWEQFAEKTCERDATGACNDFYHPDGALNVIVGLCPPATDPVTGPAARARAAVRQYAIDYFKSVPLPDPVPVMSAQEGITGARHQLNNQIDEEADFTDPDTAFGPLFLYCYATFDVDWGDGTHDTYTDAGASYPNSKLTHSYAKRGTYAVNVTVRWSADWSFGDISGNLTGLQTQATVPAFPVGDLQAVLIR